MRGTAILTLLCFAPVVLAADPPSATVTGRTNGRAVSFPKGMGTIVHGLAIATFGSAQVELMADKARWDAALQGDHVLIRFPEAEGLAANIQGEQDNGKTYAVSELLVPTTLGTTDALLARVGDQFLLFGKWDPSPVVLLRERWGIGRPSPR